jgi:hypothetical protein
MEIVLALAAVAGISLIAVPRLRRRSRSRVRADAGKQWTTSTAARRRRPAATGGARSRSGWGSRRTAAAAAGGTTATAIATEPYDEWDDDLDWGDTAVAAPPAGPAAPLPESDLDWQLPGEAVAEPAEEPEWDDHAASGNGNGVAPPVDDVPAAAATVETPGRATPHDDARTDAPSTEEPDEAADLPTEPDWDWEPVVSRRPEPAAAPAVPAASPAAPARGGRIRARGRKLNPLVLVALYAAFGIGVLVIAVSVISGAMSGPDTNGTPRTSATVEATPEPTPPAASGASAASAEAKRLQQAFVDQSAAVIAQETGAVRAARAAARRARVARRKARAARRRAAARRAARHRTPSAPTRQAPATPPPTTPVTPAAPLSGGGGGGGGGGSRCEFCLE